MKRCIWISVAVLAVAALVAIVVIVVNKQEGKELQVATEEQAEVVSDETDVTQTSADGESDSDSKTSEVSVNKNVLEDSAETNVVRRYKDDKVINSYVVGNWQNIANSGWHCVFYDEMDEDGMCWGKEWDESENVFEEDLVFHKNGWFKWKIKEGVLHKFVVMDMSSAFIHKSYDVVNMKNDQLVIQDDKYDSYKYTFVRVSD